MQRKISWVNIIKAQAILPLFSCDMMFLTGPFSKVCIYVWIYILKVYTTYIKIINHKSYISNNYIICVTIKCFIARALTNIVKGLLYICNTINLFENSVFFTFFINIHRIIKQTDIVTKRLWKDCSCIII